MKRVTTFWAGVGWAMCLSSLIQDIQGQSGMLEMIQHHWTSAWYTAPLASVGLFGCAWIWLQASKEDERK